MTESLMTGSLMTGSARGPDYELRLETDGPVLVG